MTELEIRNFYSVIDTQKKLTEQVRKYYGKEISPEFNSLDFWKIDENKVSQIIAFFLDPNGKHEQGDIYLKHFIEKFKLDFVFDDEDSIQVKCELITDNGRKIDIAVIKNTFEKVIGIENKIYETTTDQKNQLSDYSAFLEKKSNDNHCLIYLSPQGKMVSSNSIGTDEIAKKKQDNTLKFLTYEEHIIECIREFSLMTENTRVKSFLKDFEKRLTKMYMGENDINVKQMVVDYIEGNERNMEISFLILNSLDEVKKDLKRKFESQIAEIGEELGIEVEGLNLNPQKWNNHYISFYYQSGGLLYGLIRKEEDPNRSRLPEIEEIVEDRFKESFRVSYWWPMYQFFYSNIENSKQFWLDILNGEAKKRAKEFVKLINDEFDLDKY